MAESRETADNKSSDDIGPNDSQIAEVNRKALLGTVAAADSRFCASRTRIPPVISVENRQSADQVIQRLYSKVRLNAMFCLQAQAAERRSTAKKRNQNLAISL